MKKRFQKIGMWKIVFSLLSMLLLLTNCQDEDDFHLEEASNIEGKFDFIPSVFEAKQNFEQLENTNFSNTKQKQSRTNGKQFYVDWKNSKVIMFNPSKKSKILYTPIILGKTNKRTKAFIGSVKQGKKRDLKSRLFTVLYHEDHTDENFSGYLFEKKLNGKIVRVHNYVQGVRVHYFKVEDAKTKSEVQAKADECELTEEDMIIIIEMLEASGGGTYTQLDCVTVTGYSDINNDDSNSNPLDTGPVLTGGYIPSGGGSSSYNEDPREPQNTDQWWHEETDIKSIEQAVAMDILDNLPTLSTPQKSFVRNPANHSFNMALLNFLNYHQNSGPAQDFADDAINAAIKGDGVDFEEMYTETATPDDNYNYNGIKSYITNPIILSNGDKVSIKFGTTKSDNKNANQKVSIDLIEGLKFALEEANSKLGSSDKITSLYVMATTNGKHSSTSNHSNGTAIDISRINGNKMALSGVTNQIKQLQKAFDNFTYIRENFGPYFKHKYSKESGNWNYNYPVNGHKDHIHISIRK